MTDSMSQTENSPNRVDEQHEPHDAQHCFARRTSKNSLHLRCCPERGSAMGRPCISYGSQSSMAQHVSFPKPALKSTALGLYEWKPNMSSN